MCFSQLLPLTESDGGVEGAISDDHHISLVYSGEQNPTFTDNFALASIYFAVVGDIVPEQEGPAGREDFVLSLSRYV